MILVLSFLRNSEDLVSISSMKKVDSEVVWQREISKFLGYKESYVKFESEYLDRYCEILGLYIGEEYAMMGIETSLSEEEIWEEHPFRLERRKDRIDIDIDFIERLETISSKMAEREAERLVKAERGK